MRLIPNSVHGVLVLAAIALALAPKAVLANDDHAVGITGTFAMATVTPSAVDYCASAGIPIGGTSIEFQGIGNISKLGPLFLTVKKCAALVDGVLTYAGTFTMTAGNGDTLSGTYGGARIALPNQNGFAQHQGAFTVTGGTGRFRHAKGVLSWTAVTSARSVGVAASTVNQQAFYLVQGRMLSPKKN